MQLTKYAKQVTLSEKKQPDETVAERKKRQTLYGKMVLLKEDVDKLVPSGVLYKDGTKQDFDVIIYATGKERCAKCESDLYPSLFYSYKTK